jgi:SH3-like domain-containing protein
MKPVCIPTHVAAVVTVFFIFCSTAFAQRMAVSVPEGNVRSGPGKKHQIIWKVEKYHPLKIIKKVGKWYRFRDYEGDEGWIHTSIIDKTATVITKKDDCNVRSGPGTNHKIILRVARGIPFKVLKRKGSWFHIQHADGDKGWIYKTLVW